MTNPLIRIALSFVTGILLGSAFLFFPWTTLIAAAVLLVLSLRQVRQATAAFASVCTGVVAGALAFIVAATSLPPDHVTRTVPLDGSRRELSGRITSPLQRDPDRTVFRLDVVGIDGSRASGSLRATVRDDGLAIGYDDRITVSGRLFPPRGTRNPGGFDYPAHLARQGIHGVVSIRRGGDLRLDERGSGLLRKVQDLRERIRQALLHSTTGDGSAVLQAMVLGEEGGLTDDLRARFMAAGVTHILSISGSHLGLVAILCFWMCRHLLFLVPERHYHRLTLRLDPRKIAAGITVVPVTFYAFLAGGEIATIRALIMILAGLAALLLDRESDILSALALAALVTLLPNPRALFDISFQLSYLSVVTILFVVDTWNRLRPPTATPLRKWLQSGLLLLMISAATALTTGPLVARHFQQVSFAGIAANMVVVPFAGAVVVPLGLTTGILSLLTGSLPLASLTQASADAFIALVSFFSRLPGAAVPVRSPGPLFLAGYAGLVGAAAVWARSRLFGRYRPLEFSSRTPRVVPLATALSVLLLLIAATLPLAGGSGNRITFLDVGQGDCALIETVNGRSILIDGGGTRDGRFDVGRRVVVPYLRDRGISTIDLVILSHPHPDHVNGLLSVLEDLPVRAVWWSGEDAALEGAAALRQLTAQRNVPLRTVSAGDSEAIGDSVVEVLNPGRGQRPRNRKAYAAENDRSLVVRLHSGGQTLLFPGDLHRDGETALLRQSSDVHAFVVKVPHHGSKSSSSEAFIRAVSPSIAVFSVGEGNPYRHPADEVIERYRSAGADIFRTDRDGAVIMQFDSAACTTRRWTDLMLRTIDAGQVTQWGEQERRNWERVWIRTTEI